MILIPTQLEQKTLQPLLAELHQPIELCGFGPIAAAARTAQLIAKFRPTTVTLVGIAGSYTKTLPIGTAATFARICCYGVGANTSDGFQTGQQLGWPYFSSDQQTIEDTIEIQPDEQSTLLTVCAAAGTAQDVQQRLHAFPNAVAEDMEAFGVAMACAFAEIPLRVIRGISNIAGDRDKANWQIPSALTAAAELTLKLLK